MNPSIEVLANKPKYFRSPKSTGGEPRVTRDGGYYDAGLIRGVSVITTGEALGHEMWIDATTLNQVAERINMSALGVKSRFTHPSMSGDGLGKTVGRVVDAAVRGEQVVADQHLMRSAHKSPDGDLAGYLMDLAEEDPTSYGLSMSFTLDDDEMSRFAALYTDTAGHFRSPDPLNTSNFPHVRVAELHAIDAVDEPAANPNGLFHRSDNIAMGADALVAYAIGITDDRPQIVSFGVDPDRLRSFVARFLSNHTEEVKTKLMQKLNEQSSEPAAEAEPEVKEEPVASETSTTPAPSAAEPVAACDRSEAAKFRKAFGDRGAVWFAEGLSFDEARECEVTELRADLGKAVAEVAELRKKLSASQGENSPVSFNAADEKKHSGFASKIKIK